MGVRIITYEIERGDGWKNVKKKKKKRRKYVLERANRVSEDKSHTKN